MKRIAKNRLVWLTALALLFFLIIGNVGGMSALNARASTDDKFIVQQYNVDITVQTDRKLQVREEITVLINTNKGTMFYRSLPTDGARYENIEAKCEGNDEFDFYVADNEETGGFIDVNCVGNIQRGNVWTYEISYLMEQGVNTVKNGMQLDVVGYGWTLPLHNVTVDIHLPSELISTKVYTDVFGQATDAVVTETHSADRKDVTLKADVLELVYSEKYDEYVANGITFEFVVGEGVLQAYASTRIHTKDMWKVGLGCGIAVLLAALIFIFFNRKRDMITVVNVNPPKGMDPMKMGKWIDGAVNSEDVTSMIYYFANKGYLKIDLTDQDDPKLISMVEELPDSAPAYEKTLFDGLFEEATTKEDGQPFEETASVSREICVSKLEGKFFTASQTAIKQIPDVPPMYEKKSIFAYISGSILGAILAFLIPFILSKRLGGGYGYYFGFFLALPLVANALIGYFKENYRYKWKKGKRFLLLLAEVAISIVFTVIFVFIFAEHVMTEYEKLLLCLGVFASSFLTQSLLSRTETYSKALEDILGFKEFIVVTEEDKIKTMLEINPELYYTVLPYAQVLGVTDEWEGKFKKLLVQPPTWCVGADLTWFDCYILHRCINRSMMASMARAASAAASKGGGGFIGRSGGGGSFGGFGGGGFGGGGGGIR